MFNEAITFFEDALEKNSSGKLGLADVICDDLAREEWMENSSGKLCLAETDVVFDDSSWTLLKKVSPGYAVFDELNEIVHNWWARIIQSGAK